MNRSNRPARRLLAATLLLAVPSALAQAQPPPPPAAQPSTRESQALPSLAPLVDSVNGAVVNVDVQSKVGRRGGPRGPGGTPDDFMERFFGQQGRGGREPVRQGAGSGFIIDPSGLVVTNNHVVENAVSIRVRLKDGRSFDADVVGRDAPTDVALIRLKGKVAGLPSVKLGNSDAMRVGDWAVAIGNPFGLASSVSLGIISARARSIGASNYDDFLQTDAAINPGNSGGPLFNMRGEVIGMNTAIVGGGAGIGFAVPSNLIQALLPQLQKSGTVTRGYLGVGVQDLTADLGKALGVPASEGAVVTLVTPGSPGQKAGLKADDVIVAVDGQPVASSSALIRNVALKQPGTTTTLSVLRGAKKQDVKVTLTKRPPEEGQEEQQLPAQEESDEGAQQRVGLSVRDLDPRTAQSAGFTDPQAGGALITDVLPTSPAERAELAPGMVVVEANRKPVKTAQDLRRIINAAPKGSTLLLRIAGPGENNRLLRALQIP
jgi:serine protease Do